MNDNSDLLPNFLHEEFEMQMRGYSRRQVDEFVARRNSEIRDMEQRLTRALDESEHLRRELSSVRQQALSGRPAHQEVSERIAQILKLADDEARAQKSKADEDIAKLRAEAQQESDRLRADAREQAERMLTAAQEQAERTIAAARAEADKTRTTARTEADRLTGENRKKADAALANAKAQAKMVLDEATARATAIHDGAERRLNHLSTRHADTVRRLTDILDGVQGLVAAEVGRKSLEEEVNESVAKAIGASDTDGSRDQDRRAGGATRGRDRELSKLAPPAPETVATGAASPPRSGPGAAPPGPGATSLPPPMPPRMDTPPPKAWPGTPTPETQTGAAGPEVRRGGATPETRTGAAGPEARPGAVGPVVRPGGAGPEARTGRVGPEARTGGAGPEARPGAVGPETRTGAPMSQGPGRDPLPMPGSARRPGPAMPGTPQPERDDTPTVPGHKPDASRGRGLIDPDEPTEGIRLME